MDNTRKKHSINVIPIDRKEVINSLQKIDEYLKKQNLSKITEEQRQIINGPLTIWKVFEAIEKD